MIVNKPFTLNPNKDFDINKYPLYDNYNAFNVDKIQDIPINYETIITEEELRLLKSRNIQFEILEVIE
jgi:hypothetical protein